MINGYSLEEGGGSFTLTEYNECYRSRSYTIDGEMIKYGSITLTEYNEYYRSRSYTIDGKRIKYTKYYRSRSDTKKRSNILNIINRNRWKNDIKSYNFLKSNSSVEITLKVYLKYLKIIFFISFFLYGWD